MNRCNVCGAVLAEELFNSGTAHSLTSLCEVHPGPALVFACSSCGHLQTPELKDVSAYYESAYKILINSDEEDQIYDVVGGKPTYRTQHQVATLGTKIQIQPNALVLDYGSAKGATIRALARNRADIVPHLFDVSDMYVPFWEKFARPENWSTYQLKTEWHRRFDIVISFFAFEHIVGIGDAIGKVAWLLKDKGIFYCVVPNVLTNVADFVVVDHVNHFSASSIKQMLAAGGLAVVAIDDQIHRGAFVIVAQKMTDRASVGADKAEVAAELARVSKTAAYWRGLVDRIRTFERERGSSPRAVYGSGFYGAFIATTLAHPEHVRCFLDQNPYLQGRAFFGKPVLPPEELPADVNTLLVGLNPVHARRSISDIAALQSRKLDYFFCD
jgi:uncharacterized protein YhbP (UPF0306 family)